MEKGLVSVIIPTLNEEKNIRRLLFGIKRQLKNYRYEIIVVDKHSPDKTASIARSMGARVIYDDFGKGSAIVTGVKAAKGDILISMDADLSNEPREFPLLIDAISIGYDICMGSRFLTGGGSEDIPPIRRFGNEFFVWLVNILFHAHFTDLCYGYRSFRKGVLEKLDLDEKGFGIEAEISIRAVKKELKIIEMPSTEKKRAAGEGKLRTFHDGYIILRTILMNVF